MQLGCAPPLLLLEFAKAFSRLRLAFQSLQLPVELVGNIRKPFQVFDGVLDAVLRLPPPFPILGDAGGLLQVSAQLLGLRLYQLGDHALLDDRIAARAEAGSKEHVGDIPPSAAGAVQVVEGLAIAVDLPTNGDLRIGGELALGEFAANASVPVVEDQLDGGQGRRWPGTGTVEDDIGECLGA